MKWQLYACPSITIKLSCIFASTAHSTAPGLTFHKWAASEGNAYLDKLAVERDAGTYIHNGRPLVMDEVSRHDLVCCHTQDALHMHPISCAFGKKKLKDNNVTQLTSTNLW